MSEFENIVRLSHKRPNAENFDPHPIGWLIYHCMQNLKEILDPKSEFENIVRLSYKRQNTEKCKHFWKIWPPPNWMADAQLDAKFQGDSRSEVRTFKFHQWHMLWLYLCLSHFLGKFTLNQSGWSKHHLDLIFREIQDLQSEISNCTHSILI